MLEIIVHFKSLSLLCEIFYCHHFRQNGYNPINKIYVADNEIKPTLSKAYQKVNNGLLTDSEWSKRVRY